MHTTIHEPTVNSPLLVAEKNNPTLKQQLQKFINTVFKVTGPGFVVAIGYMDPGNWATDLAAGSEYGYQLLSIILFSNFLAIFLQSLCVRLGVVSGKDLAQASKAYLPSYLNILLYLFAEIAMIATDLAEIIGGAIALQLLTGLDLKYGILITCVDVIVILAFWTEKFQRYFEILILIIVLIVFTCFAMLVNKTQPVWSQVFEGYLPSTNLFQDSKMLYLALGVLGATVMVFYKFLMHSASQLVYTFFSSLCEKVG